MSASCELVMKQIDNPESLNFVLGHSHFIKTAEDLYEVMAGGVPGAKFGLAFCEASGDRLVRLEGNDNALVELAKTNAMMLGAGHSFIIFMRECYPINVLNAIKGLQEVCTIFCATSNPVQVILAQSSQGRGILGVIDGGCPKGIEGPEEVAERTALLRKFGYKRG